MGEAQIENGRYLHQALTERVIGAAIEVHRELGPGLLESAYEACLAHELSLCGVPFRKQVKLPIIYKDQTAESGFRIDLFVDQKVIVELKAVDRVLPIHEAQLLTYMKLTDCRVGLLINFNVKMLKQGITRRVL